MSTQQLGERNERMLQLPVQRKSNCWTELVAGATVPLQTLRSPRFAGRPLFDSLGNPSPRFDFRCSNATLAARISSSAHS